MKINKEAVQSLLAKLLATENITVQYNPAMQTAAFDLKNRVLMLPVWEGISQDLKDMLLGHETGHALDTPCAEDYKATYEDIAKKAYGASPDKGQIEAVQSFLNVVEDARIDKRQKRRYPGLRKNYLAGYKELLDRDFFGTKNKDVNGLTFIDKANIYFKGGNLLYKINFTPDEARFIKRMEDAETFNEVKALTEEIFLWAKDQIETQNIKEMTLIAEGEEGDGDGGDGESGGVPIDGEFDFDPNGSGSGAGDGESKESQLKGKSKGGSSAGRGSIPASMTDKVWREKQKSLASMSAKDFVYIEMPDADYKKAIHGYKQVMHEWRNYAPNFANNLNDARRELLKWRRAEKDSITFMVSEFERRKSAEIYSRISIAKTGVLDTNKLHSYRYSDDLFRRHAVIPKGKNHGFVMFLDWSGSMRSSLRSTLKQLFSLVLFCKQIQVPFEVFAFKDHGAGNPWRVRGKNNCLQMSNVVLRQFLSSKMRANELNEAMTYLWMFGSEIFLPTDEMSGTPLNDAILLAPKVVEDFRQTHKVEILSTVFLTDGESNYLRGLANDTFASRQAAGKKRFLYNDRSTGKTYEFYPYGGVDGQKNTQNFLQMLKDKTDCNLLGFYLFDAGFRYLRNAFFDDATQEYAAAAEKFWDENKFCPVTNAGYDEYYVVSIGSLKDTHSGGFNIRGSATKRAMETEFSKFLARKSINRVLLRRFVDKISGYDPKKVGVA